MVVVVPGPVTDLNRVALTAKAWVVVACPSGHGLPTLVGGVVPLHVATVVAVS